MSREPRETIDRLERIATSSGLRMFARIDHAAGDAGQVSVLLAATAPSPPEEVEQ